MENWTKRTLQATLISGGLLMLGTGIASASENVNPDVPASPLDQLLPAPELHGITNKLTAAAGDLQAAPPLQHATTAMDLQHPTQALSSTLSTVGGQRPAPATDAPVSVLYPVPVQLLQHDLAPSAQLDGDLPEHDLHAPLGSELGATALPSLPAIAPASILPVTLPGGAPAEVGLPPVRGTVSTEPLAPSGTRVTGVHTGATPAGVSAPVAPARPAVASGMSAAPAHSDRADTAAGALPLLGGLLPTTTASLPTSTAGTPVRMPSAGGLTALTQLTRLPEVTRLTELARLTRLTQSSPLASGGRYNTAASTSTLNSQGAEAAAAVQNLTKSATALLRK